MKQSHPSIPLRIAALSLALAASLSLSIAAWAYPTPSGAEASAQANVEVAANTEKPSTQGSTLVLRETDGMVCVYRDGVLFYKTDIPVVTLPEQNRVELARGIEVANETEMHRLLEDFGS